MPSPSGTPHAYLEAPLGATPFIARSGYTLSETGPHDGRALLIAHPAGAIGADDASRPSW